MASLVGYHGRTIQLRVPPCWTCAGSCLRWVQKNASSRRRRPGSRTTTMRMGCERRAPYYGAPVEHQWERGPAPTLGDQLLERRQAAPRAPGVHASRCGAVCGRSRNEDDLLGNTARRRTDTPEGSGRTGRRDHLQCKRIVIEA